MEKEAAECSTNGSAWRTASPNPRGSGWTANAEPEPPEGVVEPPRLREPIGLVRVASEELGVDAEVLSDEREVLRADDEGDIGDPGVDERLEDEVGDRLQDRDAVRCPVEERAGTPFGGPGSTGASGSPRPRGSGRRASGPTRRCPRSTGGTVTGTATAPGWEPPGPRDGARGPWARWATWPGCRASATGPPA